MSVRDAAKEAILRGERTSTDNQGPIVDSRVGTGRRVWFASLKASPRISNYEMIRVSVNRKMEERPREAHEVVDETADRRDRPANSEHADVTELSSHFSVLASEISRRE